MKAFGKSAWRLFRKHIVRLITVIAIVFVSIGVMSGIGELEGRIKVAVTNFYKQQNVSDLYVKSVRSAGFTADELSALADTYGESNILRGFSYETTQTNGDEITGITRVYAYDLHAQVINKMQLLEGRYPQASNELLAERGTKQFRTYAIGDQVLLNGVTYTVCGVAVHPLLTENTQEPSFTLPDASVTDVLYLQADSLPLCNDVYVTLADRGTFRAYSKAYKRAVTAEKEKISALLGDENAQTFSLYENVGLYSIVSYAEKVGLIGIVFVVFFLLVTMLVVYSNMSRLYDEERAQMACLKTLGYGNFAVLTRYSLFVTIGTVLGGLLALPVGIGLTSLLYSAFYMQYAMPPFPGVSHLFYYFATFAIILISMLLLTFFTGLKIVQHDPVTLLRHKTPKSGKKVILERIGFLWNKLSFKYKSTFRNVLLFKSRFFMTVISVIGSTVLVLAGFGLMDCCLKADDTQAILGIAVVLIVFSGLLCGLVIYNLTNINVSERNREIATLMVLGYHDREVTGYIFREIYIMCLLGAVLGVPLGLGFLTFVFHLINFGTIGDINWWTWILAPAVTMLFAFLSTLLLRRKITKTDMNASLKTLE